MIKKSVNLLIVFVSLFIMYWVAIVLKGLSFGGGKIFDFITVFHYFPIKIENPLTDKYLYIINIFLCSTISIILNLLIFKTLNFKNKNLRQ